MAWAAGAAGFLTICGLVVVGSAGECAGLAGSAGLVAGGWTAGGVSEICAAAPVVSSVAARIDIVACGVFIVIRNYPCAALAALQAVA